MPKTVREFFGNHKRLFIDFLLAIILILVSILALYLYRQYGAYFSGSPLDQFFVSSRLKLSPTPAPIPIGVRPLPGGKQVYNYSSVGVTGPVPSQVTIDPLTPAVNTPQIVLVKITYSSPVTKASILLHTDNKITTYPLQLIEGTTSDGTWKGSWLMPDSYNYTYYLQFDIESSQDSYKHGLMFR